MLTDPLPVVRTLNGSPYRMLDEFFSQHGERIQEFRINPMRQTTLVGRQGTRFTLFPSSLCDVSGKPVQNEVLVRLIEIGSRPEMVRSNKMTTSEDRFLESGGQFFIQAISNYHPLSLCRPVEVELPVAAGLRNPLSMRLYRGSAATTRPYRADRAFDWQLVTPKPVKVKKRGARKFYVFELSEFNWFSCCNLFARRSGRTMISVKTVSPVQEFDDLTALLVFRHVNAVARMYPAGNKFTLFNIPVRMPVQAVVIGLHQGQLYYGQTGVGHSSGQLLHIPLVRVDESTLLNAINIL